MLEAAASNMAPRARLRRAAAHASAGSAVAFIGAAGSVHANGLLVLPPRGRAILVAELSGSEVLKRHPAGSVQGTVVFRTVVMPHRAANPCHNLTVHVTARVVDGSLQLSGERVDGTQPLGASRHPHPASTCQLYLVTFNMSPSTCQPPPPLTLTPTLAPGTELIASPPAAASAVSELSGREPSASSPSSSFDVEVVLAEPLMPGSAATVGIFASSSFAVTIDIT